MQRFKLNVKLIYSCEIDLDIVPLTSDKGQAMQFLHQNVEICNGTNSCLW
ncbi:MAG: HAD family hydrolase [Nostoc sp. ChiSLP02]|nr:HAD family hydrolase [Nostoc sp. DedSLP05]MDZ8098134.1 HAD family hydrolase [Nostoc sp. DedSLP01]MDZ8184052.1 HAD family hydrolase [Nostoc sp. ChiSLP02]